MFITQEQINRYAGVVPSPGQGDQPVIDAWTVDIANLMIETYVGRSDAEVTDGRDRAILARATVFQAIYINQNKDIVLEQAAVASLSQNESVAKYDTAMFAPFMSPWAVMACKSLSWKGSRSVHTGPINSRLSRTFKDWWLRA